MAYLSAEALSDTSIRVTLYDLDTGYAYNDRTYTMTAGGRSTSGSLSAHQIYATNVISGLSPNTLYDITCTVDLWNPVRQSYTFSTSACTLPQGSGGGGGGTTGDGVYIYTNGSWQRYIPYIYNGSSWEQYTCKIF